MTNGSQEEFMLNKSSSQLQIFLTKLNKVINVIKTTVRGSPSFSVRVSGCFCTDMTPVLFFEQRRNLLGFSQAWMMGRCDGLAGWCRSQTTRAWISPEQVSHSSVCSWIDAACYPGSEQQNSPRLSAAPPYRSVWGWAILTLSAITACVWYYITDAIKTSQSWYTLSGHFIRDP